jgi:DNA-binding response OmpR family regulator
MLGLVRLYVVMVGHLLAVAPRKQRSIGTDVCGAPGAIPTRDLPLRSRNKKLEAEGFEVCSSDNAEETLKLAKSESFDLYLLDNWLSDIDGPTVTAQIREFDATTPILFYSGVAYEADQENARSAGAQAYLVKPVENEKLVATVNRLIAESKRASNPP